MTLTGVKKHVRALEDVGMVEARKEGRVRTVSVGRRPQLADRTRRTSPYTGSIR